ncbi:hypothetical protein M7784_15900 [Desulfovibrio aminophilus]|nr:hypothetical protein [Desulfovibrio aminophilus]MCM0756717.1 hypothetical protein [Desulfovibrio aminophilus]
MRSVNSSEFSKISYLDTTNLAGRIIPLHPCYHENGEWEMWIDHDGKLIPMRCCGVIDGVYWGKIKAVNSHQNLKFMNVAYKRLSFNELSIVINGIYNDILNLSCTFSKYDIYINYDSNRTALSRIISSELEFIFSTARSIFDLMQEYIRKLRERMINCNTNSKLPSIKKSFASIVLCGCRLVTKNEMILKYKIEDGLADCYAKHAKFFLWVRDIRDKIIHSPKNFDLIFAGEEGFSVLTRNRLFSDIEIWNEINTLRPNSLGSVKSLTAYIINKLMLMLDDFFSYFESNYQLPPDIAPKHNLFSCSPHIHHLEKLNSYMTTEAWYSKK